MNTHHANSLESEKHGAKVKGKVFDVPDHIAIFKR